MLFVGTGDNVEWEVFSDTQIVRALSFTYPKIVVNLVNTRSGIVFIDMELVNGALEVSERITGLELGADDYVIKPFSPKEL